MFGTFVHIILTQDFKSNLPVKFSYAYIAQTDRKLKYMYIQYNNDSLLYYWRRKMYINVQCFGLKSIVKVLVLFVIYVYVCTAIIYSSLCDR